MYRFKKNNTICHNYTTVVTYKSSRCPHWFDLDYLYLARSMF